MDYVGIDLHQKYSEICVLSQKGAVRGRHRIPTTETSLRRFFRAQDQARIIFECSGISLWVNRILRQLGHEVLVVNPRRIRLIAESTLKCDRIDAEILAQVGRMGGAFLRPVYQRSEGAQELRTRLRVRSSLVKARTALINSVRGSLQAQGYRLGSGPTSSFMKRWVALRLPGPVRQALDPLAETIANLCAQIERLSQELAEEAGSDELLLRLQDVPGVGLVVSLAFIAWVDRPERFQRSRSVGACLGLRPSIRDSAGRQRRGRITREGDTDMRRLLVQAAHASLHCYQDSALKRWATKLIERVGKSKAVVALARKIGVLLHRLWVTGEEYRPFPQPA